MNGRVDGGFLGILPTSFCLDLRGELRLFCLYFSLVSMASLPLGSQDRSFTMLSEETSIEFYPRPFDGA